MEKKFNHFVGIDISKIKFDSAIIVDGKREEMVSCNYLQDKSNYDLFLQWVKDQTKSDLDDVLFCMEHTGVYNIALVEYLCSYNLHICVEAPMRIKLSIGLQRGKNDKIDAKRIAWYAYKNQEELNSWQHPREKVRMLKLLLTQRSSLVQAKTSLQSNTKEIVEVGLKTFAKQLKRYSNSIKGIEKDLVKIDADIKKLVKQDEQLNKRCKQITSIPGMGFITATHLIAYTNEFKTVRDGKQLACYCGVAPFEHTSGTSVRGKTRVSHKANKTLKSLLHMCALSSIQLEGEFKQYYERKKEEGKNSMAVINAIRNKLLLRVTALIRNDSMYVYNYVYNV
jgi:transposase